MIAYRWLFAAAALYNLAFGLWGALDPGGFTRHFALPPMNYPSIWGCLAMVVGLYGLLYAYVAWKPEEGDWIIAIGLAGKVLGPIGWVLTVAANEFPPRTVPLVIFNDLIWWYPFAAYLLRRYAWQRPAIVGLSIAAHLAACVGLLLIQPGTELEPDAAARQAFIAASPGTWAGTWLAWMLSSLGLVAICVAWTSRLFELTTDRVWRMTALSACVLAAFGAACDLLGEWVLLARVTQPGITPDALADWARIYQWLSPGIANGLYCVAGLMLSAVAWQIGWIRGWLAYVGFAMWLVGLGLTAATVVEHTGGMVAGGAGVMILFLLFAAFLAPKLAAGEEVELP